MGKVIDWRSSGYLPDFFESINRETALFEESDSVSTSYLPDTVRICLGDKLAVGCLFVGIKWETKRFFGNESLALRLLLIQVLARHSLRNLRPIHCVLLREIHFWINWLLLSHPKLRTFIIPGTSHQPNNHEAKQTNQQFPFFRSSFHFPQLIPKTAWPFPNTFYFHLHYLTLSKLGHNTYRLKTFDIDWVYVLTLQLNSLKSFQHFWILSNLYSMQQSISEL